MIVLAADDPEALERATEILRAGGLVAFPTDTVYGLGAAALDGPAVARLYQAKGRPSTKAIPVLIPEPGLLEAVGADVPDAAWALVKRFWPGPLTLVVARSAQLPGDIGPGDTVGVRMPDHPVALALLRAAGPLAVTSANRSGQPSLRDPRHVESDLEGRIDLLLDGGVTPGGVPSTVVDPRRDPPQVLRAGPISRFQILEAIREG